MTLDLYRLQMGDALFVFVDAESEQRREQVSQRLRDAGARCLGPRAWSVKASTSSAAAVKDLISELDADDCVYVLAAGAGELDASIITQAKTTGGVIVGS